VLVVQQNDSLFIRIFLKLFLSLWMVGAVFGIEKFSAENPCDSAHD
jgi:hypothetical protein